MIKRILSVLFATTTVLIANECCVPHCWSGFYIGMSEGYGWGRADTQVNPLPDPVSFNASTGQLTSHPNGWMGGGQLGYNWQMNRKIILGLEFDAYGAGLLDTSAPEDVIKLTAGTPFPGSFYEAVTYINWFGTLRGRFGYAPSAPLFLYATGGVAWGHVECQGIAAFVGNHGSDYIASVNKTKTGWTVGAGFEYALARRLSFKTEYLYMNFGSQSVIANPNPLNATQMQYVFNTQVNSVRAGLNYSFGLGR